MPSFSKNRPSDRETTSSDTSRNSGRELGNALSTVQQGRFSDRKKAQATSARPVFDCLLHNFRFLSTSSTSTGSSRCLVHGSSSTETKIQSSTIKTSLALSLAHSIAEGLLRTKPQQKIESADALCSVFCRSAADSDGAKTPQHFAHPPKPVDSRWRLCSAGRSVRAKKSPGRTACLYRTRSTLTWSTLTEK